MRNLFAFIFLILSFNLLAQNYSGQYPGAVHFYSVNGSNTLTTIKEDSNSTIGSELIRFPQLLMRDVLSENIVDTNCMFWGGQECLYKQDGPTLLGIKTISDNKFVKYFNFNGDSLTIRFDIPIGNTQTVFRDQDTNLLVKYFCLSKDTATLFGVADSIILFTLITTDSLSNLMMSPLSGDTVVYSKNTGLVKGFSFDYFPTSFSSIELKGIRNPDFGFIGLTYADIYNFQIGDQFEQYVHFQPGPYYFNEILTRTDTPSDVVYSIQQIERTSVWNGSGFTIELDTFIISQTYSKINFIDEYGWYNNGIYTLDTSLFSGCYSGIHFKGDNYSSGMNYCPSQNCLGSADLFMFTFLSEESFTGAGFLYGDYNTIGGTSGWRGLTYLNKQGFECGSSTILSNQEFEIQNSFSIFPNPSSDIININSSQPIQNGSLSITDLSGRIIEQFGFNQFLQLDLSNYPNGIYFVKMISGKSVLTVQKFIKQ